MSWQAKRRGRAGALSYRYEHRRADHALHGLNEVLELFGRHIKDGACLLEFQFDAGCGRPWAATRSVPGNWRREKRRGDGGPTTEHVCLLGSWYRSRPDECREHVTVRQSTSKCSLLPRRRMAEKTVASLVGPREGNREDRKEKYPSLPSSPSPHLSLRVTHHLSLVTAVRTYTAARAASCGARRHWSAY